MGALVLPHGLFDADGDCHREVWLRPLVGADEVRMLDAAMGVERADRLLSAGVARLGEFEELDASALAALTRGDRAFLLLRIWAQEHGERATLVVRCANPDCAQRADLDVHMAELAPEGVEPPREQFSVATPAGPYILREPTAALDAAVADGDRATRVARLWAGLVIATPGGGTLAPEDWPTLPLPVRAALAAGLATASRAPDLLFFSRCPSCAAALELVLDPLRLFERREGLAEDRLLAEVHCLAWYYHWSQAEILGLTRAERWRYLDLIRRQVEGRPLLDRES